MSLQSLLNATALAAGLLREPDPVLPPTPQDLLSLATPDAFENTLVKRDADGNAEFKQLTVRHLAGELSGSDPSLDVWAPTTLEVELQGHDFAGQLTLNTTGIAMSTDSKILTVYFANAYENMPIIFLHPANKAATSLALAAQPFLKDVDLSSFSLSSNGTALATNTEYIWNYMIVQGKSMVS